MFLESTSFCFTIFPGQVYLLFFLQNTYRGYSEGLYDIWLNIYKYGLHSIGSKLNKILSAFYIILILFQYLYRAGHVIDMGNQQHQVEFGIFNKISILTFLKRSERIWKRRGKLLNYPQILLDFNPGFQNSTFDVLSSLLNFKSIELGTIS